jgi:hypothetical protein
MDPVKDDLDVDMNSIDTSCQLGGDGASIGVELSAEEPHCFSGRFQDTVKFGECLKWQFEHGES